MLQVIFQTSSPHITNFELEYITKVLLAKVGHVSHFDNGNYSRREAAPLIVYSTDLPWAPPELEMYTKGFEHFSLLHLSNESLGHNFSYYGRAAAVLRSYYDPAVGFSNTFAIPLGFKSGFLDKNRRGGGKDNRYLAWVFCGQMKSDRAKMLEALNQLGPHVTHMTASFTSDDQHSTEQLVDLYRRSAFIPCPFGNINPDSFRIMESLECGCIPVCIRTGGIDYYKYIYGEHPFVIGDSWQHCARLMQDLWASPDLLKKRQESVSRWYESFLDLLATDVASILGGVDTPLISPQFRLQREGHMNVAMRAAFLWRFGRYNLKRRYRRFVDTVKASLGAD